MAAKFKKLISDYCVANRITVPPGFARNTPNRYVIIRINQTTPKLIATTWFKSADVLYFIENHLTAELGDALSASIQILDFKTAEILAYDGGGSLKRVGSFSLA